MPEQQLQEDFSDLSFLDFDFLDEATTNEAADDNDDLLLSFTLEELEESEASDLEEAVSFSLEELEESEASDLEEAVSFSLEELEANDDDVITLPCILDDIEDEALLSLTLEDEDEGSEEALLSSAVHEVESEDEMADAYASQDVNPDPVIEIPKMTMVSGVGDFAAKVISVESSSALGSVEAKAAKVRKARAITQSSKIMLKLGEDVIDFITLTADCASKSDDDLITDFEIAVDSMASKVSDKAVNLFDFMRTGGGLNEVTRRGFEVMIRDGMIAGSPTGNLHLNLLSKPYSPGTASSQTNQIMQLFTDLKIGLRTSRGVMAVNEDSVLLSRYKTLLGK